MPKANGRRDNVPAVLHWFTGSAAWVSLPQSSLRDASSLSEGAEIGSRENAKLAETTVLSGRARSGINSRWERETIVLTIVLVKRTIVVNGATVLIPNGNAKLEHFVFISLLYHDIRILSMRNLLNRFKNLVNPMGKGELYTF